MNLRGFWLHFSGTFVARMTFEGERNGKSGDWND